MKPKASTRKRKPDESILLIPRVLRNPQGDITLGYLPVGKDGEVLDQDVDPFGITIGGGCYKDKYELRKLVHDKIDEIFEKGVIDVE